MDLIEWIITQKVETICNQKIMPESSMDIIETDNLAEVIEKLIILHIRMWMLEDKVAEAETNDEIALLKKKIDICFKQKRPKLVAAINKMIDNAIRHDKSLIEDSVKLYKEYPEQ